MNKAFYDIRYINPNPDGTLRCATPQIGSIVYIIVWNKVSGEYNYDYAFPELIKWGGRVGVIQGFTQTEDGWPKIIVQFGKAGMATFDYFMVQMMDTIVFSGH